MIVDWSGAPEDCVGALVACVGNIHFPRVTFVKSVIHEQNRVRGESCDGSALCAYLDVWAYEERPWTGEGLPPVGTLCEFAGFNPEETIPTDPRVGDQVTVIAHFMSGSFEVAAFTFYAPPEFEYLQVAQGAYGCFRPVRTPEQIAVEEREKAIEEMIADTNILTGIMRDRRIMASQLYDSGYRKQSQP